MLFRVVIRDVLPFPLELPDAIAKASSHKELESISHMGIGLLTQLVSLCMILFSHYVQKREKIILMNWLWLYVFQKVSHYVLLPQQLK